jgi:hypothetical protein
VHIRHVRLIPETGREVRRRLSRRSRRLTERGLISIVMPPETRAAKHHLEESPHGIVQQFTVISMA